MPPLSKMLASGCPWRSDSTVATCKKVKASHTRYRALRPELIPVYRQSARRWTISHSPGGKLPLLSADACGYLSSRRASPHLIRHQPSYTAWWQRHIVVNNLPKVVTQRLPRVGFEPKTCWSQVQRCIRCDTVATRRREKQIFVLHLLHISGVQSK